MHNLVYKDFIQQLAYKYKVLTLQLSRKLHAQFENKPNEI